MSILVKQKSKLKPVQKFKNSEKFVENELLIFRRDLAAMRARIMAQTTSIDNLQHSLANVNKKIFDKAK